MKRAGPATEFFPAVTPEVKLSEANFSRFAAFITAELGIKMPPAKIELLQNRLLRRARMLNKASLEEYAHYFFSNAASEEREHLINAVTTNKTDFFREPNHFSYLCKVVLPEMHQMLDGNRFQIWSAGCSSGEEAYTMAMLLEESPEFSPGSNYAILGTDVSTRVLQRARAGIYPYSLLHQIPSRYHAKYLLSSHNKLDRRFRIHPRLRSKVSFHALNFMDGDYGINNIFHVVFFRNVLIYFDRVQQEEIIEKICRNLAPGGYLFVGHSESLSGLSLPVNRVGTSIYKKD